MKTKEQLNATIDGIIDIRDKSKKKNLKHLTNMRNYMEIKDGSKDFNLKEIERLSAILEKYEAHIESTIAVRFSGIEVTEKVAKLRKSHISELKKEYEIKKLKDQIKNLKYLTE